MPTRAIQALTDLERRLPRAGKIKLGIKTERAMRKLTEFRFLSPYRDTLEQLAVLYGGEVRAYRDEKANPPDQFELLSNAAEIDVLVLPGGLSMHYEKWVAGGCERRCDGVNVEVPVKVGKDDYDFESHPCLCKLQGARVCEPKTRLNVVLPQCAMRGAWLLETKSWNAAEELPGVHDMIVALNERGGYVQARLGIDQRVKQTVVGKRNFVVPVLTVVQSPMEIASGAASIGALGVATNPALGTVATPLAALGAGHGGDGDGIVDAEVLDEDLLAIEAGLRAEGVRLLGEDQADRFVVAMRGGAGVTDVPEDRRDRLRTAIQKMKEGVIVPMGFKPNGTVEWK